MKTTSNLYMSLTVMVLTACGGGGGDTPTTATANNAPPAVLSTTTPAATTPTAPTPASVGVADKYVGTWSVCLKDSDLFSTKITSVFLKTSESTLSYNRKEESYRGIGCVNPPAFSLDFPYTVSFYGTKTVASDTVDKINSTFILSGVSQKDIALVKGNVLRLGADYPYSTDADGYPTALDTVKILTRQ